MSRRRRRWTTDGRLPPVCCPYAFASHVSRTPSPAAVTVSVCVIASRVFFFCFHFIVRFVCLYISDERIQPSSDSNIVVISFSLVYPTEWYSFRGPTKSSFIPPKRRCALAATAYRSANARFRAKTPYARAREKQPVDSDRSTACSTPIFSVAAMIVCKWIVLCVLTTLATVGRAVRKQSPLLEDNALPKKSPYRVTGTISSVFFLFLCLQRQ